MSTVRSFIAVELSDPARTELTRLQERLKEIVPPKSVRWTAPKNVHLTLHFLGDVAEDRIEDVSRTLRDAAATHTPFSLNMSNLGCFPNTHRARIVWVGISGETERLGDIHRQLGSQLHRAIRFKPESRPYSPHLTIGRIKKDVDKNALRELGQILEEQMSRVGQLATLHVDSIHLIQSDLKPDGPIYTSLVKAPLRSQNRNVTGCFE